jgi:hypothetical protein
VYESGTLIYSATGSSLPTSSGILFSTLPFSAQRYSPAPLSFFPSLSSLLIKLLGTLSFVLLEPDNGSTTVPRTETITLSEFTYLPGIQPPLPPSFLPLLSISSPLIKTPFSWLPLHSVGLWLQIFYYIYLCV